MISIIKNACKSDQCCCVACGLFVWPTVTFIVLSKWHTFLSFSHSFCRFVLNKFKEKNKLCTNYWNIIGYSTCIFIYLQWRSSIWKKFQLLETPWTWDPEIIAFYAYNAMNIHSSLMFMQVIEVVPLAVNIRPCAFGFRWLIYLFISLFIFLYFVVGNFFEKLTSCIHHIYKYVQIDRRVSL